MVVCVNVNRYANLPEIRQATRSPPCFTGRGQGRENQCRQNSQHRYHDEQFDQSKPGRRLLCNRRRQEADDSMVFPSQFQASLSLDSLPSQLRSFPDDVPFSNTSFAWP